MAHSAHDDHGEGEEELQHLCWSSLHHPTLRTIPARSRNFSIPHPQRSSSEEAVSAKMHQHRDSLFSDSSSSTTEDRRPEPPPLIHTLFEELTETWQYVVACPITRHAVIIDPHLDNAPSSTTVSTIAADRILSVVSQNRYYVDRILHTHESMSQGSSAWYIRAQLLERTGLAPKVTVGRTMAAVQRVFKRKYSMNDGSAWRPDSIDNGFSDGQEFMIGNIKATALHFRNSGTLAFVIGQHVFAGTSMVELELRNRNDSRSSRGGCRVVGDLKKYRIYTSRDDPPARRARLVPIYERPSHGARSRSRTTEHSGGRKLVIKYGAENEQIAELEG